MARKIDSQAAAALPLAGAGGAAVAAAEEGSDELDVLHPERQVMLGGRRVTVREYGHVEWLRLLPRAAPLVGAIANVLDAGIEPSYEQALEVMAEHIDGLAPLVCQACDLDGAAFAALAPDAGELLLMTWWGVNGRFFVARAINRVAVARAEHRAWAGARSTPPSSPTATAAPSASAATPSGS